MKKILIISGVVAVLAISVWLIFFRSGSTPIAEIINNGLPFGSSEGISIPAQSSSTDTVGQETSLDKATSDSRIFRVSSTPVAGFTTITRGGESYVRYVDRATGHIFDSLLPRKGESSSDKIRITNNTLPKIYEAYFRPDGNAVLLRTLEDGSDTITNTTLTLTAPRATTTGTLYSVSASNLRGNIDSPYVGAGDTLYYVLKDTGTIASSNFSGGNQRSIFNSNFSSWRLSRWGTGLLVYTKAVTGSNGYAYSLSTNGTLTRLLGPLSGLTAVGNSAGNRILYSTNEGGVQKLFVRDTSKNTSSEILPASLAEKCVWSTKNTSVFYCGTPVGGIRGSEPDGWYRGETRFTDYVWMFDISREISKLIIEPKSEFDVDLDVYEPRLSPNEDYLVFMSKRDLTLWGVRLEQE